MEIVLQQFNINEAINSHWQANLTKNEIIETDRETALETATRALKQQFQRELDTYLDSNIQSALNCQIFVEKLDVFGVWAVLVHNGNDSMIYRDTQNWTIKSNLSTITTTGDLLQKSVLLELGRINVNQKAQ